MELWVFWLFYVFNKMLIFLDELKALNLPAGQYAIFGSRPLAVRNLRDANDIDLIVK